MSKSSTTQQRRILGASGAFIIALVVVLGGIDIYFDYQKTIEAAFVRLENLARIADESVSGRMRAIDIMLQDVARESQAIENQRDEDALLSYMKARAKSFEEVRSISVSDQNGRIIYSTLPELKNFDGSKRPYFTAPFADQSNPKLFIHGPILASTGKVVVFTSRSKTLKNDQWDGVAIATLPAAYFASVMDSVRPQDDGFATLLGIEGTIIARSPDQEKFTGKNIAKGPAHAAHVAAGQRMTRALVTTATEGRRNLVVSRTTNISELVVAVGWTEEVVLTEWRDKSLIKGGVLCLLTLIAILVLRRFAQHEDELLSQRNFARQLVETANVMVVGLDRNGVVQVFNAAAEHVTGFAKAEIRGRSWFDTAASGSGMTDMAECFRAGEPLPRQFDGAIRTRDGRERVISWQNSVVSGQDIVSMSFGIDMTDRLQAERELIESQRFIQAIAENMPGMVAYWDADMRCRFANKPYLDWFGKPPEQIIGKTMLDLMGENLFAMNEPHIRAALKGEKQDFERTLTKANGEIGYTWAHYIPNMDVDGTVLGFFVLVSDITPLKRTENQLRETSERLALAAKAGGIGVWDYDLDSQRLTWDDRMFQLYGIARNSTEHVYEMWQAACHPSDRARAEAEVAAATNGEMDLDTEFRILTPAGDVRHIKAAAAVERNDDGKPVRMIGVNWDITAIRENEVALAAAQDVAEKANRAKSEFLANMSHEIRTPMNAILGLSHLLERTPLSAEQRDYAAKIKVAGRGLLSIINDILDFSRVEAGRLELENAEFLLPDLLDAISTIISVNASTKDLELVIGAAPGTPINLVGDALRLQQVLINLTSNAIKFTKEGEVALRVEQIGLQDDKAVLRFSVQDSGIGIHSHVLPSLFDAFTQADSSTTRRFGGSGLGLAISKRLVELMGGKIGVESQPGHGSTFWFTVPLAISASASASARSQVERDGVAHLDVLIADDHDIAREVIAITAASLGWTPEVVGSGREALERAQERLRSASPFDVVILDWKMPEMDGLAVSRAVRSISGIKASPIVIMVTAHNREDLLHAPGAEGIDAVLVKPVTGSSLFNAVMEARARRSGDTDALIPVHHPAADGPRLEHVRLLVVEDNSINQDVAKRVLELEGATVTIAADGQQAVDRLAADPTAFDAVLMDVQMPVMDGYAATMHIRRELGLTALPILALTAGALTSERNRAQQAGMDDFIAKPFDVDQMVQSIRRHVALLKPAVAKASGALLMPKTLLTPDIFGIDMRQASLRLGDDTTLFASLLTRLEQQFGDTVPLARAELAAGKADDAARRLHTLRGAAGNVAAVEVAALASDGEAAIRDGRFDEIEALLERLHVALGALVEAIRQSGISVSLPVEANEADATAPLNRDEAMALVAALTARSMNAVAAFDCLRVGLTRSFGQESVLEIARAVEELRFDTAAQRLNALLDETHAV
ncbi:MAG: response regulator [Rhodospirillaceae bacterium]|nr:response regulator [Rhodospirillales bacterium]